VSARTPAERLQRIEQILASSTPALTLTPLDPRDAATNHLQVAPLERMRQLTVELQARSDNGQDEVDALAMRLLLNDYATAVAHLRAVARDAGDRIDAAAAPLNEARRAIWRAEKALRQQPPAASDGAADEAAGEAAEEAAS